ncbi:MAG: energy transducer TonB [Chitinophagaceae bacterium]
MKKILYALLLVKLSTISATAQTTKDTSIIDISKGDMLFTAVQVESEFIGGSKAWSNFIIKNLNAEVPKDRAAPAGKYSVEVSFVVDKDGSVSNIKALTKNGYGTEEEVIRVLKLAPKWVPGYQNGVAVKSLKKQRITFVVEEESVKPKRKVKG